MNRHDRWAVIAMVVAYGVIDVATTIVAIRAGYWESNPVPKWFFSELGLLPGALVHKTLILLGLGVLVFAHWKALRHLRERYTAPESVWFVGRYTVPAFVVVTGIGLGVHNTLVVLA